MCHRLMCVPPPRERSSRITLTACGSRGHTVAGCGSVWSTYVAPVSPPLHTHTHGQVGPVCPLGVVPMGSAASCKPVGSASAVAASAPSQQVPQHSVVVPVVPPAAAPIATRGEQWIVWLARVAPAHSMYPHTLSGRVAAQRRTPVRVGAWRQRGVREPARGVPVCASRQACVWPVRRAVGVASAPRRLRLGGGRPPGGALWFMCGADTPLPSHHARGRAAAPLALARGTMVVPRASAWPGAPQGGGSLVCG